MFRILASVIFQFPTLHWPTWKEKRSKMGAYHRTKDLHSDASGRNPNPNFNPNPTLIPMVGPMHWFALTQKSDAFDSSHHRRRRRGQGGRTRVPLKFGKKYFSGNCYVKFGHFSGKNSGIL